MPTHVQLVSLVIAAIVLVLVAVVIVLYGCAEHRAFALERNNQECALRSAAPVVIFLQKGLWEQDFITNELLPKGTIPIISVNPLLLDWPLNKIYTVVSKSNGGPDFWFIKQVVQKLKPRVFINISDENANYPQFDNLMSDVAYYARQYCHLRRNPLYKKLENVNYIPLGCTQGTGLTDPLHIAKTSDRQNSWGFVGSKRHGNRKPMLTIFGQVMGPGDVRSGVPAVQVSECYLNCVFVPQGRGHSTHTCFRHFEASMAGAIPVLCRNGYRERYNAVEIQDLLETMDNPPWLVFDTWKDAAEQCKALLCDPSAFRGYRTTSCSGGEG